MEVIEGMPRLSIIVPVYQKEKYLDNCIYSLLSQSLSDIEIILVDDGSTDKSGEICDSFREIDSRVKVIHQKNGGVSAARNTGLNIAQGEYIGFVDADDWVSTNMYETLITIAEEKQAEIVACAISVHSEDGSILRELLVDEMEYSREDMLLELFSTPDKLGGTCCNKVFRRDVVREVRFPVGISMCEDRMFLLFCYDLCLKCVKISVPLSHVVESLGSATRKNSIRPLFEIISSSKKMIGLSKNISNEVVKKAKYRYLDDSVRYLRLIREKAQITGEPYAIKALRYRMDAILCIIRCAVKKELPQNRLRGFLYGLVSKK